MNTRPKAKLPLIAKLFGSLLASIGIPTRVEWRYHTGDGAYCLRTRNYYAYRLFLSYDSPTETWTILNY